jgi:4-diphosphocytidyl-2-C-methyl-D-erythritol kinase
VAEWEAPAKLNLSLLVRPLDRSGYHPLRSLAQAVEWCDVLAVEEGDDDQLEIAGADLPESGDNLVWKAVAALGRHTPRRRPPLQVRLTKRIPVAAGLAGGSADAAAMLRAVGELLRIDDEAIAAAAEEVGADVPFALVGGTAWMEGRGERLTRLPPLDGFAVAMAVPPIELATPAVFRRWDELGGPIGDELKGTAVPPALRDLGPLRNDLTPAAASLAPQLVDWMGELATNWGRPVAMSGSGPSAFAFFADLDEAAGAADALELDHRAVAPAGLRHTGPTRLDR